MEYLPNEKEYAESYQPLFNILSAHGLTPLQSEMDEIIGAVESVKNNWDKLFRSECDVDGCILNPTSGGGYWRETGYWSLCDIHWREGFDNKPQPKMKPEAIAREASRDNQTGFLPKPNC